MGLRDSQVLFKWRASFMSTNGPPSTTRYVLLALSRYMDPDGTGAFPSIATLAKDTGLSQRAVKTHLALAVELGWIERKHCRRMGQKWRNYEYRPRFPIPVEVGERPSPPFLVERGANHAEAGECHDQAGEPRSP